MVYVVGYNGSPIGNHPLRVLWSRDKWRNLAPNDQGHDSKYLKLSILQQ